MNTTTNWSAYRPLTASEQELFQNLLGKELGVEALLVSLNDSDNKFTEYIFMYNHPDPSTPNLVSFYAKVENKKETVVEFATAQLTATMATSRLVENSAVNSIVENVSQKVGFTSVSSYADVAANYSSSSQANYYFDCDGDNGNSRGSFCSILQRLKYQVIEVAENGKKVKKLKEIDYPNNVIPFNEIKSKETLPKYYILTAAHNLGNKIGDGTTIKDIYGNVVQKGKKSPFYKLIKDASNYIELELIADYRTDGYDAAVLQIKKITEAGKVVYDLTDTTTKNDDIAKSKDFYGNAIKFDDNYLTATSNCESPNGALVGYVSKTGVANKFRSGESIAYKLKNNSKDEYEDDSNGQEGTTYHELFNPGGQSGDSGGCEFIYQDNKITLDGVYRGKINRPDCSKSVKLHGIAVMYKDIKRSNRENKRVWLKDEYKLC